MILEYNYHNIHVIIKHNITHRDIILRLCTSTTRYLKKKNIKNTPIGLVQIVCVHRK